MTTIPQAALKAAREALLETVRKYGDVGTRDVDVARKRDAIAKAVEAIDTLSEIAAEEAQDWQLVPRDPTQAMWFAGGKAAMQTYGGKYGQDALQDVRTSGCIYEAMLAAAPGAAAPSRSAGEPIPLDDDLPPWLLPGDVAMRIANEHRVRTGAVQSIAKTVARLRAPAATEARDDIMRLAGNLARSYLDDGGGSNNEMSALLAAVSRALGLDG